MSTLVVVKMWFFDHDIVEWRLQPFVIFLGVVMTSVCNKKTMKEPWLFLAVASLASFLFFLGFQDLSTGTTIIIGSVKSRILVILFYFTSGSFLS